MTPYSKPFRDIFQSYHHYLVSMSNFGGVVFNLVVSSIDHKLKNTKLWCFQTWNGYTLWQRTYFYLCKKKQIILSTTFHGEELLLILPQSGQVGCVILCPFCSMHGYRATLVKFNQKYLRITISQKSCMSFSKPLFFWFPELLPIFG